MGAWAGAEGKMVDTGEGVGMRMRVCLLIRLSDKKKIPKSASSQTATMFLSH